MKQCIDLLSPLSAINFNLCLKDIDFDILPHDLKAYTLVEMEEWDDSSRETTEDRRSPDLGAKAAFEVELDKLRLELEQLREVKEEMSDVRERLQSAESESRQKDGENEQLRRRVEEQGQLIRDKQEAIARMEMQLSEAKEDHEMERRRLDEVQSIN